MDKIIWYLMESSVMLVCLYILYLLILRKETFFSLNRFYLLSIVVFSLVFPLLSFDFNPPKVAVVQQPIEEFSKARLSYYDAFEAWSYEAYHTPPNSSEILPSGSFANLSGLQKGMWVLIITYLIGVVICLSRTVWTVQWIYRLIGNHPHELQGSLTIVKVRSPIAPFSFLKYVFVADDLVNSSEFDHILAHERTHVRQRHSIDLIIVQLVAAFLWFNPVIWRLIKSLKTTHEYIADNNILNEGYSLVEYQTLLLRQLISNNSYGLVHNFNLSFIKKRITMMKNKKSGGMGKVKVALVLACTIIFGITIVQCNSVVDEQVSIVSDSASVSKLSDAVNLPTFATTHFQVELTGSNSLQFTVTGNKLEINGTPQEVSDIVTVIKKSGLDEAGIIVMAVDKDQSMGMIRDIQTELRRANRRKMLYLGQTASGARAESTLLLPPLPGDTRPGVPQLPRIDDKYIAETGIDVLKIHLGDNDGFANQEKVDAMVRSHIQKQSSNYVVSAKYKDSDTYDSYIRNLVYIQEGFYQIYIERAQEMFGRKFFDLDKDKKIDYEQYRAVRNDIPMVISIAEESVEG